jgi:hypothetical protein
MIENTTHFLMKTRLLSGSGVMASGIR